jgi:hypothetical protein
MLVRWWEHAAATDPAVGMPGDKSLARTPVAVLAVLSQLSKSSFFAGLAMRSVIGNLKQVRRYLFEPDLREEIRGRVASAIGEDTRVVVAHSLGSVVAYETLCSLRDHPVRALVT